MKIVIVDDNKSIRDVLRALCESEAHEIVAEFADGTGLVDFVKQNHPDLVCLDFNLPGADGLELLAHMDAAANRVNVVMITGSEDPELKGHAADFGAMGFIRKPFEHTQIINELREVEETQRIAARAAATPVITAYRPAEPDTPATSTPVDAERTVGVVPRSAVIVDDSGSVRLLLKGILEEIGVKVIGVATSGTEGIKVVKATRPAIVCLDVDMPGMTGIEALPEVRSASPQSKVVMITGNASRAIVEAAVSGGAKGYFLKPIRPAKVEEFIKKLLQL